MESLPLSATIVQIDNHPATTPTLYRLIEDPAILVIDFPDLLARAQMLNRIAAFVEKSDAPHDRILSEDAMNAHIRASGANPDEYYEGHDYRAADLARFFRPGRQQNMPLNPQESWLATLVEQQGWSEPNATGALITIPGPSAPVDRTARTAIFRHELSHGAYFTDPAYAALSRHLWNDLLSDQERKSLADFLGRQEYNIANTDLIENQTRAYLIHTGDKRFFDPAAAGLTPERSVALRSEFIAAIDLPWLRENAFRVTPAAAPPASAVRTGRPHPLHARAKSGPAPAARHENGGLRHAAPGQGCRDGGNNRPNTGDCKKAG